MFIQIFNGQMYAMDEVEVTQEVVQPTRRRRHSKEFKAQVIRAAIQPNASIAAVALHYRLNANMLRSSVAARVAPPPGDVVAAQPTRRPPVDNPRHNVPGRTNTALNPTASLSGGPGQPQSP